MINENIISLIHDNKLWGIKFNFDGSQFEIKPNLILDIDFVKQSYYSENENKCFLRYAQQI